MLGISGLNGFVPVHLFMDMDGELENGLEELWWSWFTKTHRLVIVDKGDDTYGC